ncbi:MAG: DegT/DnrJ/EryC1/StrS family aminotransferase [Desulfuromusa sp.]
MRVPVLDLTPEIDELWEELNTAIQGVLHSTHFIMGPEVKAFEREVAEYLGAKHAIGVNSGTDALVIGLRALGIGAGDEVITSPFTFFATAESISAVGATPVFVDIDSKTYNINPDLIEEKITSATRAIMPVHLFGRPAEMRIIMNLAEKYQLKVIEDVAQAFSGDYRGKKLGTMGDMGAYSFFPSKNLGCYGDGGLLVTNDDTLADSARMLRVHGAKKKYYNEVIGYNSRLDSLQAAILRVKLPHIDAWSEGRRRVASRYNELLDGLPGIITPEGCEGHVFHQYTIQVNSTDRDELQRNLAAEGIGSMIYYPVPVHKLPIYQSDSYHLPVTESVAKLVLSLPIWPQMEDSVIEYICDRITLLIKKE